MKTKHKSGFSLVEIMVAILVLVVLALGGGAVMYQTGGDIQQQQNKREAIVAANLVLENLWNTTYADLGSSPSTPISVTVNGITMTVSPVPILADQTDASGDKYHQIQVSVNLPTGEPVILTGRRYERGLSKARVN